MANKLLQGLLSIEFFSGPENNPKRELLQSETKRLNEQISKELQTILPNLKSSSYAIAGGLYQSNEILQPGFPIHSQIRQYLNAALKGENNKRNQLIIGANAQGLPEGLQTKGSNSGSPLLLIPFVVLTENEQTQSVFENELMHKGMVSRELFLQLQSTLGAKIRHANFMTVLDLAAMMHNHYQMMGFDGLWEILEESLFNSAPEKKVILPQGNEFYLSKKIVFTPFYTFHYWQSLKQAHNGENEKKSYMIYTQIQRQYVSTLTEHGLDVRQFLPNSDVSKESHICFATLDKYKLTGDYYHEVIKTVFNREICNIEKHEHQHLGLLFYKLADKSGGLEYYYPLTAQGVSSLKLILVS